MCGAPGGKSIHIAQLLSGSGRVITRDVSEYKVSLIEENIRRHQVTNMTAEQWDARVSDKGSIGKADVVIADLPCSGLGVLRKKPDIKYRMQPEDIKSLIALEREILSTVHQYVKSGGRMIYSTCTIDAGENEENVAVVPEVLKDFNSESQRINKIDGKTLVGKNLVFADESGREHKLKIVGVYNTSDPIFTGNQILIPRNSLIEFNNEVIANAKGSTSITSDKAYKILIDDAKNLESVQSKVSSYCEPYTMDLNFDSQSYNIALIIIIGSIVFFALFVIAGQYMFVKSNISRRSEELALYRSLGYKSNQLFYIIFAEYFLIGIISIAVGTILTILLDILLINPYLMNLVGNTMMEMTVNVSAVYILLFLVIYLIVLAIVSIWAVKRSEKTDLSVLLRER